MVHLGWIRGITHAGAETKHEGRAMCESRSGCASADTQCASPGTSCMHDGATMDWTDLLYGIPTSHEGIDGPAADVSGGSGDQDRAVRGGNRRHAREGYRVGVPLRFRDRTLRRSRSGATDVRGCSARPGARGQFRILS